MFIMNEDNTRGPITSAADFMRKMKYVSVLSMYTRYLLVGILAHRFAHGFLNGVLYFLGLSVGLFFITIAIVQTLRLFCTTGNPLQRETYLMNCAVVVPNIMTICLLVYTIVSW